MFIPTIFEIKDKETAYSIMEENAFALLISQHDGKPYATHLPMVVDKEHGYLYGHFARANPQWKDIGNQNVLAVFQGPHSYISPSWYETQRAVPTWNYVTVHAYGKLEIIENQNELFHAMRKLVLNYEGSSQSYDYDQLEPQFIEGLAKGLVAFKIKISRLEGKAKLSQDHTAERQKLVIEQLEKKTDENSRMIADLMKENLNKN
ncbi:FMN-binding negative transcriptional regulator [Sporolactobacillus laevolacticus]|uniref:FMN-binding negative transcriptional regulator n=1 Tax=Sporolactobacillus laevolacticus TaxID=33018 RepID=UPI0025B5E732|nr:FMN-binding negative transcriptional regulator [Sporolactobacillus laevolacticus]MDN3955023.1 FMN-binding negative transcriptional regulator [Sporolactobacillus laevolacticus]